MKRKFKVLTILFGCVFIAVMLSYIATLNQDNISSTLSCKKIENMSVPFSINGTCVYQGSIYNVPAVFIYQLEPNHLPPISALCSLLTNGTCTYDNKITSLVAILYSTQETQNKTSPCMPAYNMDAQTMGRGLCFYAPSFHAPPLLHPPPHFSTDLPQPKTFSMDRKK